MKEKKHTEKTLAEASLCGFEEFFKSRRNRSKSEEEKKKELLIKAAKDAGFLPEAKRTTSFLSGLCGAPTLLASEDHDEGIEWEADEGNEIEISFDASQEEKVKKKSVSSRLTKEEVDFRLKVSRTLCLCLFARGLLISRYINNTIIKVRCVSLLPLKLFDKLSKAKRMSLKHLTKVTQWFSENFSVEGNKSSAIQLVQRIVDAIELRGGQREELCIVFAAIIRSFGFPVRIIKVIDPLDKKHTKRKLDFGIVENKMCKISSKLKKRNKKSVSLDTQEDNESLNSLSGFEYKSGRKSGRPNNKDQIENNRVPVGTEWCEVWCGKSKNGNWTHVDPINGLVNQYDDFEKNGNKVSPFARVLGFEGDCVVDVSRRYLSPGHEKDKIWLSKILKFNHSCSETLKSDNDLGSRLKMEEKELEEIVKSKSNLYPKTLTEFKNSSYILESKIGKYKALIPGAAVVSYFRSEPFYHKSDVDDVRSVENWKIHGYVVKKEEIEFPYKIVNLRKETKENEHLPKKTSKLYGRWQADPWVRPIAKDGIVPRNEYGNVELPPVVPALPLGTVYLPFPCLEGVCKNMDIDCAPALTGFSYKGGKGRPKIYGIVLCQEYEEKVMDAYKEFLKQNIEEEAESRLEKGDRLWRDVLRILIKRVELDKLHDKTKGKLEVEHRNDDSSHLFKPEKEEI